MPLYVPATAAAGMVTITVGFHDAELFPTSALAEKAVCELESTTAFADAACPGVNVPTPDDAVALRTGVV